MGFAPALVDTYQRYKKGTQDFVQWLAETAHATGQVKGCFREPKVAPSNAGGGRLKGKARKEAKARKVPKMEVPVNAMAELAHAIVNTEKVGGPLTVLRTLSAVIKGRKNCAKWYLLNQVNTDDTMRANNERHQHFIEVLEEIRDTLKRKQPQSAPTKVEAQIPSAGKYTNMFACLELEVTAELEDCPDIIAASPGAPWKVEYALENSEEDVSFAVYCFLRDCTHIRLHVRRTWREFKRGEIGIQAAALTMNAGIGRIEKLSHEFKQTYPRFDVPGMHLNLVEYVYTKCCNQQAGSIFIDVDED